MLLFQTYNDFKEKGELFEIMPEASGDWKKDEHEFKKIYSDMMNAIIEDVDAFDSIEEEDEYN